MLDLQRNIIQFKQKLENSSHDFTELSLEAFQIQYEYNPVYRLFCDTLKIDSKKINELEKIPFLPIEFYKNHKISIHNSKENLLFTSSGTTGINTSKNYVYDLNFYLQNCKYIFESNFCKLKDCVFLFLLPSYLERTGSSLVAMAQYFISESESEYSNFYLNNYQELRNTINQLESSDKRIFLFGVSFGLMDFMPFSKELNHFKFEIIETGGMKGRRKEITRTELHLELCNAFNQTQILSEYGMTELFSQSYSKGKGIFEQNERLKVLVREIKDPLSVSFKGKGGLNIVDLANIDSCCFIATSDQGIVDKQYFELLGRLDHSDSRGCNLMILD